MGSSELVHAHGASLHEGVVGAREHGLGVLQALDLTCAGLLTRLEVSQKPVALTVKGSNLFNLGHVLLLRGGLLDGSLLKGSLLVRLSLLLLGNRCCVSGALVLAILHE